MIKRIELNNQNKRYISAYISLVVYIVPFLNEIRMNQKIFLIDTPAIAIAECGVLQCHIHTFLNYIRTITTRSHT